MKRARAVVALLTAVAIAACGTSGDAPQPDSGGSVGADGAIGDAKLRDGHATSDARAADRTAADASARDSRVDAGGGGPGDATSEASLDAAGDAQTFGGSCVALTVASCPCATGTGTRRCFADGTAWGSCTCESYGAELYVAPTGKDSNPGTLAAPFLTPEAARTAVRAMKVGGLPQGGVVVWLRGGVYARTTSFALGSGDSGTTGAPVIYRGYPGETARWLGGVELPASSFHVVTASSSVWSRLDPTAQGVVVAADLTQLGITDFGTLKPRGFASLGTAAALELFIDGARQPLGRWPDQDATDATVFDGFTHVASVSSNTAFTLAGTRPARWSHAPDPWVHGFFTFT